MNIISLIWLVLLLFFCVYVYRAAIDESYFNSIKWKVRLKNQPGDKLMKTFMKMGANKEQAEKAVKNMRETIMKYKPK